MVGGGKGSGERETEEWWEVGRGVVRGRQRSGGRGRGKGGERETEEWWEVVRGETEGEVGRGRRRREPVSYSSLFC